MMGALGMLTQSLVQLPGMEGVPKDISAFSTGAGQTGFLITIAIIAVLEAAVFVQDDSKEPGRQSGLVTPAGTVIASSYVSLVCQVAAKNDGSQATLAIPCLWLGMTTRMRCATARSTTAGS